MRKMKLFILFAFLLFLVIGYKTYEQYHRLEDTEKLMILNESQSLAEFISAFRQTYQDTFLRNHIDVDEKTIHMLPVKTIAEISDRFSSSLQGDIVIRTVSDRPRNMENMANNFELEMIDYFKKNPNEKYKFIQKANEYYYTKPLLIKQSCLQCHGKREDAIPSIRAKYENAYDYKLGEIRGLLNIKIQERDFFAVMNANFTETLIASIILYIIFLIIIYKLIQSMRTKEEQYTHQLETDIEMKTYEIQKQKEVFETLFEKSSDGILIIENGKFIQCNERAVKMLHYSSKDELLHTHPSKLSPEFQPDGRRSYEKSEEMMHFAMQYGGYQFEWVHQQINGKDCWTEVNLTPIVLDGRKVIYVVWRDISEKKSDQKKLIAQKDILYYQAHHDALTGLPNRILFNERLQQGIKEAEQRGTELALFFIDLDQFKQINDSLGHEIGDKVLNIVSERLKAKVRKEDTLARLGGDEFTIIMEKYKEIQNVSTLAEKILDVLEQPIHLEGQTLYISSSIGISLYPKNDSEGFNLLKYADAAMYKAKEEGRNNFQFYSTEMTEQAFERIIMKANLRQALDNDEFIVCYQPQIDCMRGKLIGMEALIRWQHPNMGLILPTKFIPIAEDSGLIVEIDQWIMKTAMYQIKKWYKEGLEPGILALNLTLTHLKRDDFIQKLRESMEEINFKSEWLELEITEGEVMKKYEEVASKLQEIHDMGIGIAIDDFGTGYSSLSYLKRLPVNKLKIDQSFIKDIPEDEEDVAIVKAIISLAKNLNLDIIAEGVETVVQKEFLLANGCRNIQGYYYGEPMHADEMREKFLKPRLQ
jgi:diguanylate cyclase (GGDEF)-like protein/PAS domain S-box-containing protein